jgi:hypothetical protein
LFRCRRWLPPFPSPSHSRHQLFTLNYISVSSSRLYKLGFDLHPALLLGWATAHGVSMRSAKKGTYSYTLSSRQCVVVEATSRLVVLCLTSGGWSPRARRRTASFSSTVLSRGTSCHRVSYTACYTHSNYLTVSLAAIKGTNTYTRMSASVQVEEATSWLVVLGLTSGGWSPRACRRTSIVSEYRPVA